jgi:DNA-directed RNA polymerase sigma subunit (sigma70/sigma32)
MEVSGLSRDIITRVSPHLNKPLSLDLKLEPELTLIDYIADPTILEDNPELIKDHLQSTVADILSCLTYQEQRILVAMFGLLGSPKMDLVEVASVEKLTVQQVTTLKTGAIKKLQAEFGELPEVKRYILSALAYD